MITDPLPRAARLRKQYDASDGLPRMRLPPPERLQAVSRALAEALRLDHQAGVRAAGTELLQILAEFYEVKPPGLTVLGARPRKVVEDQYAYELFGDYTPTTKKIRVWMRTAVLGKVTSHRGLLNTLLHEFCHHLDVSALGWPSSPHTRGFFCRIDDLYHLALATPSAQRRSLAWIKRGSLWRIDWQRMRTARDRAPAAPLSRASAKVVALIAGRDRHPRL